MLRFGRKCIYKKLWLFQDIFQKKLGGQKDVGHTPNLNFSIFFLFYIYKNGSFKHYLFLRFQISKKLTRPNTIFSWSPIQPRVTKSYPTSSRTIAERNHRHGGISLPSPYLLGQQEFASYKGSLNTLVQKSVWYKRNLTQGYCCEPKLALSAKTESDLLVAP